MLTLQNSIFVPHVRASHASVRERNLPQRVLENVLHRHSVLDPSCTPVMRCHCRECASVVVTCNHTFCVLHGVHFALHFYQVLKCILEEGAGIDEAHLHSLWPERDAFEFLRRAGNAVKQPFLDRDLSCDFVITCKLADALMAFRSVLQSSEP